MKLLALSLVLCGFCSGQNTSRGAATHQFSRGACSINAANVGGDVSVSIKGPACNSLSKADLAQIRELVQLLRDDIEARKGQPTDYSAFKGASGFGPASQNAPALFTLPTAASGISITWEGLNKNLGIGLTAAANASSISESTAGDHSIGSQQLAGLIISSGWTPASASFNNILLPYSNALLGTNAAVTADQPFAYRSIPDVATGDQSIGLKQAGGLIINSDSTARATLASASFNNMVLPYSNALLGTNAVVTADQPFAYRSIPDVATGDHIIGIQQAGGLIVSGDSTARATLAPASFNNILLPYSNALLGTNAAVTADQPFAYRSIPDVTTGDHVLGLLQLPATTATRDSTIVPTWSSVSLTFTSAASASSSTIAGTDLHSLSKSISELTSSGHTITGWTLTYLAEKQR
jgi:hypothetical protein